MPRAAIARAGGIRLIVPILAALVAALAATPADVLAHGDPLDARTLYKGDGTAVPGQAVLTDADALAVAWGLYVGGPVPEVDFAREVVVLYAGTFAPHARSCHSWIEGLDVTEAAGEAVVHVRVHGALVDRNNVGCFPDTAETSVSFVAAPRVAGLWVFHADDPEGAPFHAQAVA